MAQALDRGGFKKDARRPGPTVTPDYPNGSDQVGIRIRYDETQPGEEEQPDRNRIPDADALAPKPPFATPAKPVVPSAPKPAPAAKPADGPAAAPVGQPVPWPDVPQPILAPDPDRGLVPWVPEAEVRRQEPGPLPAEQRPGGGGGTDPREVAVDILVHVPLPDIRVRMNPALGLVALPSWFWAEGYSGESFGASRTVDIPAPVGPLVPFTEVPADHPDRRGRSFTVEVRVGGSRYEWDFGDGAGVSGGSLGRAYPAESDVRHTYRHSSLPFVGGFPVRLTVEYQAEYRVDGAGPFGLPPVRRTYETAHRVQEIQTVLVSR
jgi:hypothetical protein